MISMFLYLPHLTSFSHLKNKKFKNQINSVGIRSGNEHLIHFIFYSILGWVIEIKLKVILMEMEFYEEGILIP